MNSPASTPPQPEKHDYDPVLGGDKCMECGQGRFQHEFADLTPPPLREQIKTILNRGLPLVSSEDFEVVWNEQADRLLTLYKEQLEGERERLRGIVSGMMDDVCRLCGHKYDCKDHYQENGVTFCPYDHHNHDHNSTGAPFPEIDIVCGDRELGYNAALEAILSALKD